MKFDIITIFPNLFESFKNEALISRARLKKIIELNAHNLRDWTTDNHKTVDDRPYGGGAGMVMMVEPILKAVKQIQNHESRIMNHGKKSRTIVFSPKGKKFDQAMARKYAKLDQLILICGRYEGFDERVAKYIADDEISIGDYVLFGGEVPAMVVMEAVTRLLPGAVGKQASIEDESFKKLKGIEKTMMEKFVEYPHYTRPEVIEINGKKRTVPKILLSGNHAKIENWRRKNARHE
ncbi:MAG: tRNA (guanosine(37)-N1)-methyltransferase TrmD [Minisyncoccia bacterium]|jgi:tRNA (guanine37-N1)-methyltransferase